MCGCQVCCKDSVKSRRAWSTGTETDGGRPGCELFRWSRYLLIHLLGAASSSGHLKDLEGIEEKQGLGDPFDSRLKNHCHPTWYYNVLYRVPVVGHDMSWLCLAKPWKISEGSGQRVLSGRAGSLKSANSKLEAVPEHQCKQICKDFASTCEILWAPFCLNWFEWRRLRSITLAFKVRAAQVTKASFC